MYCVFDFSPPASYGLPDAQSLATTMRQLAASEPGVRHQQKELGWSLIEMPR